MKSLLELYGQQFRNPMPNSDSEDYTTADVFGQMGANKRRAEYDNSLLGMVHNWATGEQRQPVQLPDNAPLMDQMKEAGLRMLNLPTDMAAGGAKTMAHWLGAAGNPEMVEQLDVLAPLGIGPMAGMAGAVPRRAVGSAGGRLAAGSSENAPRIGVQSVMASAIPGYQNMGQLQRGMIADIYEHAKIGEMPSETAMRIGQRDGVDFAPIDRELGWLDAEVAKIRQADGEPRVVDGFRGGKVSADQPVMFGTDAIELARLFGDVEPVQARFKNALEVDADGKSWRHVPFEAGVHTSDDIANLARERGHDGVVFKNMFESPDYNKTSDTYPNVFTALQRGTVFDNDGNLLFADQSRSSLPGLLTNAVDEPKGFTAYHGSPHDFDRFSMDKIGTGEGAQAYGHGLYFAENEGVARNYKAALSKPESVRAFPSAEDAKQFGEPVPDGTGGFAAKLGDGSYVTDGAGGRMYEVRINADPEDFLDWDKPLSQQSKPVRDAVKELRPDEQTVRMISDLEAKEASGAGNYASRMLLARLKKRFGSHAVEQDVRGSSIMSDERAAALLRDSGIPGIRYLDQGSRGAGEGSRNYVLFRDDIIEIVKKYGIAAAASMYGMSQVQDAMASEGP